MKNIYCASDGSGDHSIIVWKILSEIHNYWSKSVQFIHASHAVASVPQLSVQPRVELCGRQPQVAAFSLKCSLGLTERVYSSSTNGQNGSQLLLLSSGFSWHFLFSLTPHPKPPHTPPSQPSSEETMTAAAQRSQRVKQQGRCHCFLTYCCYLVICHPYWEAHRTATTLSGRHLTES